MSGTLPTSLPGTLSNLLDECFPRLPDGEFPRPPSLPRGGCFPEREPREPAPSLKKRAKRKSLKK